MRIVRKTLELGATIFLLAFSACTKKDSQKPESAPPPAPAQAPDWRACQRTSECIKVPDLCGNENAINKKFLKDYQEQMAAIKAKCPEKAPPKKRHTVDCVAESCTLIGL